MPKRIPPRMSLRPRNKTKNILNKITESYMQISHKGRRVNKKHIINETSSSSSSSEDDEVGVVDLDRDFSDDEIERPPSFSDPSIFDKSDNDDIELSASRPELTRKTNWGRTKFTRIRARDRKGRADVDYNFQPDYHMVRECSPDSDGAKDLPCTSRIKPCSRRIESDDDDGDEGDDEGGAEGDDGYHGDFEFGYYGEEDSNENMMVVVPEIMETAVDRADSQSIKENNPPPAVVAIVDGLVDQVVARENVPRIDIITLSDTDDDDEVDVTMNTGQSTTTAEEEQTLVAGGQFAAVPRAPICVLSLGAGQRGNRINGGDDGVAARSDGSLATPADVISNVTNVVKPIDLITISDDDEVTPSTALLNTLVDPNVMTPWEFRSIRRAEWQYMKRKRTKENSTTPSARKDEPGPSRKIARRKLWPLFENAGKRK